MKVETHNECSGFTHKSMHEFLNQFDGTYIFQTIVLCSKATREWFQGFGFLRETKRINLKYSYIDMDNPM